MASLACANFVIYGLKSALISWLAFYAPRQKLGRGFGDFRCQIFGLKIYITKTRFKKHEKELERLDGKKELRQVYISLKPLY